MTPMTLHTATVTGAAHNTCYPTTTVITTPADLQAAARLDHVAATYVAGQRSAANFQSSDCVVMDVDNDHTDNPADWIDPAQLAEIMSEVSFMTATSRHHMTAKGATSPRPRFHVYFPITACCDAATYAGLKRRLAARLGFFDTNALDAGRFIYGTPTPQVSCHDGQMLVDEWLDAADELDIFAAFDASTRTIGEGSRNATLSRFAGKVLIRYGQSDRARELFDRKAALCDPPLSAHEVASIWASACRFASKVAADPAYLPPQAYEALTGLRPEDFTDVGQADTLAAVYANKVCYSAATKWLVYDHGVWDENDLAAQAVAQELTTRQLAEADTLMAHATSRMADSGADQVMASASSKARGLARLSPDQHLAWTGLQDAAEYRKFVLGRRASRNITATLKEAAPILQVNPASLDADPYLLNTPTGTYDLRTGARRDPDPADLITRQTAVDPTGEGAQIWQQALAVFFQNDPDLIGYVQRIVGLAAIGKVMVEALVIAYGDGRNGKSTFWNVIARVLGSYSGSISADALTVGVRRNVKPELAEARGKRLLIAAETEEGMRLSTSNVKQLASTDKIAAEKKFKDPFAFTPSHTLVLYTNHLPRVGAMDAGIWRRLIVIPFNATIDGTSDVKNYADYLFEHAGGAILAWIMAGARLIHTDDYHLTPPAQVVAACAAYRDYNDWFAHFLDDHCTIGEHLTERAGDLYQAYRAWAQTTTGWARPMADFNAAVEHAGYTRRKTNKGQIVHGLALKTDFDDTSWTDGGDER